MIGGHFWSCLKVTQNYSLIRTYGSFRNWLYRKYIALFGNICLPFELHMENISCYTSISTLDIIAMQSMAVTQAHLKGKNMKISSVVKREYLFTRMYTFRTKFHKIRSNMRDLNSFYVFTEKIIILSSPHRARTKKEYEPFTKIMPFEELSITTILWQHYLKASAHVLQTITAGRPIICTILGTSCDQTMASGNAITICQRRGNTVISSCEEPKYDS